MVGGVLQGLFARSPVAALEKRAAYAEVRQRYLADAIANLETPGYEAKDLPEAEFSEALVRAIRRREQGGARTFGLGRGPHVGSNADGSLRLSPTRPAVASLRYDGNDVPIEYFAKEMASNALAAEQAQHLLRHTFGMFETAVRGRV